ncbi:hypothetical protein [Facklamia hominis]
MRVRKRNVFGYRNYIHFRHRIILLADFMYLEEIKKEPSRG